MKGKVRTVLGDVNPEEIGRVLPHEHFELDIEKVFSKKPLFKPEMRDIEFTLQTIGWIRQFPYSHTSNMKVFGSEVREVLYDELKQFKSNGGGTIVENSTFDIRVQGRIKLALDISRSTGVNVVAGTGFYVTASQTKTSVALSEEAIVAMMTKDLTEGTEEDPSVRCGIVGETGCSWPLTDFERRTVRASAEVESTVGCPVMIHPGRNNLAPAEILRLYSEAGGNPSRMAMAHLDRTLLTSKDILEFASNGTFLEYDLFGIETSYFQQAVEIPMPSDAQRIERIHLLLQEGYGDRVLISHDIHTRHRLERFGGHGFSHILRTVVPMMLNKGISQDSIDKMLIQNPAEWLTFVK